MTATDPAARPLITVGFDDTPASHAALHWAAREARARGGHLHVVTTWDPSPVTPWSLPHLGEWRHQAMERAEAASREAKGIAGNDVDTDAVAFEGAPGKVLVEQSRVSDLLVVGSAGHLGLGGWLSGSVSRHLVHRSQCPLVVVGPHAHSDTVGRLVVSSTLDPDAETLPFVTAWLGRRSLPVHVIGSYALPPTIPTIAVMADINAIHDAVQTQNDAYVARVRAALPADATVTGEVREGLCPEVLGQLTKPGDLLVVPRGSERNVPFAQGSCPVAVAS